MTERKKVAIATPVGTTPGKATTVQLVCLANCVALVAGCGDFSKVTNMIERTLVLVKPDGVQRGLIGRIITRFEDAGLKIVGAKMHWADEEFARKHYTEDLERRRGKQVRDYMTDFIRSGPVVAFVFEGVDAIENVRKIVGGTEPKSASPGTIRGDFCHVSYGHCDEKKQGVRNIIHASADKKDAEYEVNLWFSKSELHSYKTVHDIHVL